MSGAGWERHRRGGSGPRTPRAVSRLPRRVREELTGRLRRDQRAFGTDDVQVVERPLLRRAVAVRASGTAWSGSTSVPTATSPPRPHRSSPRSRPSPQPSSSGRSAACSSDRSATGSANATIGIAAPALLLLARMVQGFSTGGEYAGATTFVAEYSPDRRRGFRSSRLDFGTFVGYALGSALVTVLDLSLTDDQMLSLGLAHPDTCDSGWRSPRPSSSSWTNTRRPWRRNRRADGRAGQGDRRRPEAGLPPDAGRGHRPADGEVPARDRAGAAQGFTADRRFPGGAG